MYSTDAHGSLWRMMQGPVPLAVIVYSDAESRDDWVEEAKTLLKDIYAAPPLCSESLDDTLVHEGAVLLTPQPGQELRLLEHLSVRRSLLEARNAPVVVFLVRGGPGETGLSRLPNIATFLPGEHLDPDAASQIDVEVERARFKQQAGALPVEWLERDRKGEHPDTLDTSLLRIRALFIEANGESGGEGGRV